MSEPRWVIQLSVGWECACGLPHDYYTTICRCGRERPSQHMESHAVKRYKTTLAKSWVKIWEAVRTANRKAA